MTPFVGEDRLAIVERLLGRFENAVLTGRPRFVCLAAETGWGKTRIVQELYARLVEKQPEGYWPKHLTESRVDPMHNRKVIFPEESAWHPDRPMPWLWWGLRCERDSTGRPEAALFKNGVQLREHLRDLTEEERYTQAIHSRAVSIGKEVGSGALGELPFSGVAMAGIKIAKELHEGVKERKQHHEAANAPRTLDVRHGTDPEADQYLDLIRKFVSAERPLVLIVDDAQDADQATVVFLRQTMALERPILAVCTAWPSNLASQASDERDLDPTERKTFGSFLDELQHGKDVEAERIDLSALSTADLSALILDIAAGTDSARVGALLEVSDHNPLALRLLMASPEVTDSIEDEAITLTPEEIRELSGDFELLIAQRYKGLPESDRRWLSEAALQGNAFLPRYMSTRLEETDHFRVQGFVHQPRTPDPHLLRFIEKPVHRAVLEAGKPALRRRQAWELHTLNALQDDYQNIVSNTEDPESRLVALRLLVGYGERNEQAESFDPCTAAWAAVSLFETERSFGNDEGSFAASESALRWALRTDAQNEHARLLLSAKTAYGGALRGMGRFNEARDQLLSVLEDCVHRLEPDDAATLHALTYLIPALQAEGDLSTAKSYQRRIIDRCRARYGDASPQVLRLEHNLAMSVRLWDPSEATRILGRLVQNLERTQGRSHPTTQYELRWLARSLCDCGEYGQAAELQREVLDALLNEKDSSQIGYVQHELAQSLRELGQLEEARDLMPRAVDAVMSAHRAWVRATFASIVLQLREYDSAQNLVDETLGELERLPLGRGSLAKYELAPTLVALGERQIASILLRQAVEECRRVNGDAHPWTVAAVIALARELVETGDEREARKLLSESRLDMRSNSALGFPVAPRAMVELNALEDTLARRAA